MKASILKLNKAGSPQAWIIFEDAAIAKAKGLILWEMGTVTKTLHGGIQRSTGKRSFLELPAIIAVDGRIKEKGVTRISNPLLFSRDDYMCLYCGEKFKACDLSRDHVVHKSHG